MRNRQQFTAHLWRAYDTLCRDNNFTTSMDAVAHIGWLLLLKITDERERGHTTGGASGAAAVLPLVEAPYRWRDWVPNALGERLPPRQARCAPQWSDDALMAFVRDDLLPHLAGRAGTVERDLTAAVANRDAFLCASPKALRTLLSLIDDLRLTDPSALATLASSYRGLLARLGYEYKMLGVFATPLPVVRFMVEEVAPQPGEHVYDPACGVGDFLIEAYASARRQVASASGSGAQLDCGAFCGQEKKAVPVFLAFLNTLLHGMAAPTIVRHNALEEDVRTPTASRFNVILANLPAGGAENADIQRHFPVRSSSRELLYLQHVMAKLKEDPGARCGLVVPQGLLFTAGAQASVREELLRTFNLSMVVSLPPGTFAPYSDVRTSLLFFERPGPTCEVLFVEVPLPPGLSKLGKETPIADEHFAGARQAWQRWQAYRAGHGSRPQESGVVWGATLEELAGRGYDLSPSKLAGESGAAPGDPAQLIAQVLERHRSMAPIIEDLHRLALRGPFEASRPGQGARAENLDPSPCASAGGVQRFLRRREEQADTQESDHMAGTPLYSPLPTEPVDALAALAAYRENQDRDRFPALPWAMEELAGSLWRNLHTGTLSRVGEVVVVEDGGLSPRFDSELAWTHHGPGYWWGGRYVIEHWIRVDHWPVAMQLAWFGVELAHHREAMRRYEERIAALGASPEKSSTAAQNRRMYRESLGGEQKKLRQAIGRMRQFAERHGLEVSLDLLNSGLVQGTPQPVQMLLF